MKRWKNPVFYVIVDSSEKKIVHIQQKQNPRFREYYTCFGYETKTMVKCIFVISQQRPTMFSHMNGKLSPRPLE